MVLQVSSSSTLQRRKVPTELMMIKLSKITVFLGVSIGLLSMSAPTAVGLAPSSSSGKLSRNGKSVFLPFSQDKNGLFVTKSVAANSFSLKAETSSADTGADKIIPKIAHVTFVSGSAPSQYGMTSPEPNPTWSQVAFHLAKRLPNFAQSTDEDSLHPEDLHQLISTQAFLASSLDETDLLLDKETYVSDPQDLIVVVLGVTTPEEEAKLSKALKYLQQQPKQHTSQTRLRAVLCDPTCGAQTQSHRFVESYRPQPLMDSNRETSSPWMDNLQAELFPWSDQASHQRLLAKAEILLARKSSEDFLFAILLTVHGLITPIDVVKSDINPSWEKGAIQNAKEFASMVQCCGPQIQAAMTDPQSKQAIDLLNDLDLRDQVGSYRVIVSNETPQLEDFTLCILQQNNCFQCDAPILTQPKVPLLQSWRGQPLTPKAARQIWIGHLDHPQGHPQRSSGKKGHPWSWKIVVGANPAYDAFPMQHQIFYPSGSKAFPAAEEDQHQHKSLWYDPVFCVETLQGELIWCKRHYRCTPRNHWSSDTHSGPTAGAWTLTTLDNGMVSEEHWTTVDAADDLSWAVLHYSGAAKRAGQSYVGALLCSADGEWPAAARDPNSMEFQRIRKAFQNCDLELWELFGGSNSESYMWSQKFTSWAESNPPPLDLIGDVSITTWRKNERAKAEALANLS